MTAAELKVVLLGVPSVGKTSLFHRFINDAFTGLEAPTLRTECCGRRQLSLPSGAAVIALWDTAGEERFHSFSSLYYKGSSAAVICYDLADYTSLVKSAFWVTDLTQRLPQALIFLCGCKSDLLLLESPATETATTVEAAAAEAPLPLTPKTPTLMMANSATEATAAAGGMQARMVDTATVRQFARQHSIPQSRLYCVSAKTGHQVVPMFEAIASACLASGGVGGSTWKRQSTLSNRSAVDKQTDRRSAKQQQQQQPIVIDSASAGERKSGSSCYCM